MSSLYRQTQELAFEILPEIIGKTLQNSLISDFNLAFPDLLGECNLLCANYIYHFLTKPLSHPIRKAIHADSLQALLRIKPDFKKFYHYMLMILHQDKWLSFENNEIQFHDIPNNLPSPTKHYEAIKEKFPGFSGTLDLLHHCVSHYSLALSEKIPAISVLYPNGEATFLEEKLAENTIKDTQMPIVRQTVIELITSLARKKPLHILEVGGGKGMVSKILLKELKTCLVNYHFTDIGRKFVLDMTRYAQSEQISFVDCFQFDISKMASDPRLALQSYDIILALDVIHATKNVANTLANLTPLLKSDGVFCLLETTSVPRWWHLIMGLAKGWWLFDDEWRSDIPLLSLEKWKKVLSLSGLSNTHLFAPCADSDAILLLARINL